MSIKHKSKEQPADHDTTKLCRNDFRFIRKLGSGTFGTAMLAQPKRSIHLAGSPKAVAIKVIKEPLFSSHRNSFFEEYEAHAHVSGHPNIPAIHGMFRRMRHTYLVMELVGGGARNSDLERYLHEHGERGADGSLHGLPERVALQIGLQIASALRHMHGRGVAHRDIGLDNVAVCEPLPGADVHVKLIDFGMATMFDAASPASAVRPAGEWCGSGRFMPPQMHAGERSDMTKADVFSFGTLLFALLCGVMPFDSDARTWADRHVAFLKLKTATLRFDAEGWAGVQSGTRELVEMMLSPNEAGRPSVPDLEQLLQNAFNQLNDAQGVS